MQCNAIQYNTETISKNVRNTRNTRNRKSTKASARSTTEPPASSSQPAATSKCVCIFKNRCSFCIFWKRNGYNTIQCNTIQYSLVQYSTVQYNTIQYNTIRYDTNKYNTFRKYECDCSWLLAGWWRPMAPWCLGRIVLYFVFLFFFVVF